MKNINRDRKLRRKRRVSCNIKGTSLRPRISIFRSNKYIYTQAIDDGKRITIASASSLTLKDKKLKKVEKAKEVGRQLGKILLSKKINQAIFDRGWYSYLGQVKAVAEGLREAGVKI
ncbi:MAG: 50S ribosomal protein L18 [Microgenomates group bacterium]